MSIRRDDALARFFINLDSYIDARIASADGADNDWTIARTREHAFEALDELLEAQSEETERYVRNERAK